MGGSCREMTAEMRAFSMRIAVLIAVVMVMGVGALSEASSEASEVVALNTNAGYFKAVSELAESNPSLKRASTVPTASLIKAAGKEQKALGKDIKKGATISKAASTFKKGGKKQAAKKAEKV